MNPEKAYDGRVIRLCELAGNAGVLDGFTFTKCHIRGPAVLALQGSNLIGSTLSNDLDAILWEIPLSRPEIVGAILVKDCLFEECSFEMVGFAGPPDFIRQFRGE